MKKLFTIFVSLFICLASLAQTSNNVLKFLGIPVDGSKAQMISSLRNKGFTYDAEYGCLHGKFNGTESNIFISENNGKVDRVFVGYSSQVDEAQIRINYNNLIVQFRKNEKYLDLVGNEFIPEDEDISCQMVVNNKVYDACFSLKPDLSDSDVETMGQNALKYETEAEQYKYIMDELSKRVTGEVWFRIIEYNGKYHIGIYYDNLNNRPNGEDL